jgi:hypothetical protein
MEVVRLLGVHHRLRQVRKDPVASLEISLRSQSGDQLGGVAGFGGERVQVPPGGRI